MREKPALRFWQIWNMCFGFLGIQFGFALQNANVSRIFQSLGASIDDLPVLWLAAPVTGLLVQPVIGYMSDRTWGRLGRRRPYFLYGAILSTLALLVMPNSPWLWVAAGTAVDPGRVHQHHDGAISRARGRHAARSAARLRLRDAEPLHRRRSRHRLGTAVDPRQLGRSEQHGGGRASFLTP